MHALGSSQLQSPPYVVSTRSSTESWGLHVLTHRLTCLFMEWCTGELKEGPSLVQAYLKEALHDGSYKSSQIPLNWLVVSTSQVISVI
jgi:hypothetical protein